MIGILYESDEWSDWKLGRELEAALAGETNTGSKTKAGSCAATSRGIEEASDLAETPRSAESVAPEADSGCAPWQHVCLINMEDPDCVERACACDLLVSRVFASAPFRGHHRAHEAMERIIGAAEVAGIPLVNPGRAHRFEVDKLLAADTLRKAGVTVPAIIAEGAPDELAGAADVWPYPCIVKPNCGGRTTHTAVLHSPADAEAFLAAAPDLSFIVEPFIEAAGDFLTRIEVVDGRIALVVKRSVAASGLSSYHEGSTYELYPDCPAAVTDAVLEAARILDIQFGSFDVIEAAEGNFIIDANSVSNVSEDCTELFGLDLMAAYAQALAERYRALQASAH